MRRLPPFQANVTPNTTLDEDLDARFRAIEARHVDLGRWLGVLIGQIAPVVAPIVEGAGTSEGGGDSPIDPEDYVLRAGDTMTGALFIRYASSGRLLEIISPDGTNDAGYVARAWGAANSPRFFGYCADGDEDSPTNTKTAQMLVEVIGGGYTGSAYVRNGTVRFVALENWAVGARGSALVVLVTPIGSAVEAEMLRVASVGVGIGTGAANNAAAKLQVDSTSQGVLFPRMTTANKAAISSPPDGLVIYDTDLKKLCLRANGAWETITSA